MRAGRAKITEMELPIVNLPLMLPGVALVLLRVTGLMVAMPGIGSAAVPFHIKGLLALSVALVIYPLVWSALPQPLTLAAVLGGAMGELLIGLVLGWSLSLVLTGASVAGHLIGQQAGLTLGQEANPLFESNSTVVGNLFFWAGMMVFFAVGGHHALVRSLIESYHTVPVLTFDRYGSVVEVGGELLTAAYVFGIRLAGPAVVALFLTQIVVGYVSRTLPQLNILSIGFPIRVLVAVTTSGLFLAALPDVFPDVVWPALDAVRWAIGF